MAGSRYAEDFVLKGGVLLAAFGQRRPTIDADTLARNIANEAAIVAARVAEIAALPGEDGVIFLPWTVSATTIRDDAFYAGVRVTVEARIATAAVKLRLDVDFGDPVTPAPRTVVLPALRPGMNDISVLGYPIETVLAEKIVTALDLGPASTRVRDYADIYSITGVHDLSCEAVREAIVATAGHRGVNLAPLSAKIGPFVALRARAWVAYRRALGRQGDELPEDLTEVVAEVAVFADGVLGGAPAGARWLAGSRAWTTTR